MKNNLCPLSLPHAIICFSFWLPLAVNHAWADPTVASTDIPMLTPMVLVNRQANLVLCVEELQSDFTGNKTTTDKPVVRMLTVDLDTMQVLQKTDLPPIGPARTYAFAISSNKIYATTPGPDASVEVIAFDARTHEKQQS